jgi:CheY-like chemotaxis protein/nitrogen-specific signal transduction histidine kinase
MAKRKKRGKRVKRVKRKSETKKASPAVRAVEAALAGIAHDIRTPLTGIVALAELLAASDLGAREREWANAIKSGADHLAALSTLIVDAARSEAAGLVLRNEPFSPRALAEAVGQSLTARAGARNVKATVVIARDLPAMVSGDLLRLRAALENLADNAVKFTHDGGVTFAATATPASRKRVRLTFTVTDSGIGMSVAELKLLFKPFAQASEQIARRYGGAGLGLVFVKRIAKVMGGDLKVTSKKGRGSAFKLTVLTERFDAKPSMGVAQAKSTKPLSILCAEDNPYARVVMKTIITELGHQIDFVDSGEAAVTVAARNGYDAVLIDVTLPGVDGVEATRRIRALPGKAGKVKVIGISGRGDAATEQTALAAGMNHYFVKPISPSRLNAALVSSDK